MQVNLCNAIISLQHPEESTLTSFSDSRPDLIQVFQGDAGYGVVARTFSRSHIVPTRKIFPQNPPQSINVFHRRFSSCSSLSLHFTGFRSKESPSRKHTPLPTCGKQAFGAGSGLHWYPDRLTAQPLRSEINCRTSAIRSGALCWNPARGPRRATDAAAPPRRRQRRLHRQTQLSD